MTSSLPPHLGTTVSFIVTTVSIVSLRSLVASRSVESVDDNVDTEVDFETKGFGFDTNCAMLASTTVFDVLPPMVRSKTTTTLSRRSPRRLAWLIIRWCVWC